MEWGSLDRTILQAHAHTLERLPAKTWIYIVKSNRYKKNAELLTEHGWRQVMPDLWVKGLSTPQTTRLALRQQGWENRLYNPPTRKRPTQ
jgi:hypothetical protein